MRFVSIRFDSVQVDIKTNPQSSLAKVIIPLNYELSCVVVTENDDTPCPLYLANGGIYQYQINQKFGSNFQMSVVYYGQLISVAYGRSIQDTAWDGQINKAEKLEEIAAK